LNISRTIKKRLELMNGQSGPGKEHPKAQMESGDHMMEE